MGNERYQDTPGQSLEKGGSAFFATPRAGSFTLRFLDSLGRGTITILPFLSLRLGINRETRTVKNTPTLRISQIFAVNFLLI